MVDAQKKKIVFKRERHVVLNKAARSGDDEDRHNKPSQKT